MITHLSPHPLPKDHSHSIPETSQEPNKQDSGSFSAGTHMTFHLVSVVVLFLVVNSGPMNAKNPHSS